MGQETVAMAQGRTTVDQGRVDMAQGWISVDQERVPISYGPRDDHDLGPGEGSNGLWPKV